MLTPFSEFLILPLKVRGLWVSLVLEVLLVRYVLWLYKPRWVSMLVKLDQCNMFIHIKICLSNFREVYKKLC